MLPRAGIYERGSAGNPRQWAGPLAKVLLIGFVILVLCLMIGQNTPPVGVGMYVACAIGKVSMMGFFLEVWPFLLAVLILVFMIVLFPPLVLFVPNLLMGQ